MKKRLFKAFKVLATRNLCSSLIVILSGFLSLEGSLAEAKPWRTLDTRFDLKCNMPVPDYTFDSEAGYSSGNAFLALLAATVAENWTDASIIKDLSAWGFRNTQLIGKVAFGSYGYITENDEIRVLAFRGTHSIHEGLIDAAAVTQAYADIGLRGRGHAGMKLNFQMLWPKVFKELKSRQAANPKPLLIVGHSLGGSVALLNAVQLKKAGFPILGVYTVAEPRLGNAELMQEIDSLVGDRFFRIENALDPVPHLPPTPQNANVFAGVFAKPESKALRGIQEVVENLDYAPLPGWTLEMSEEGFANKRGNPAEFLSEANFLNGFEAEVSKSDNLLDIAFEVSKNVKAHLGDSYVCNYLSLLSKGHTPPQP